MYKYIWYSACISLCQR